MAHSIQTVGERAEILNDMDLLVIVGLMNQEIDENDIEFKAIRDKVGVWAESCASRWGLGCIDLDLDTIALDNTLKIDFLGLLAAIKLRLNRLGDAIPAAVANSLLNIPGMKFYDYETSRLHTVIDTLRGLLDDSRISGRRLPQLGTPRGSGMHLLAETYFGGRAYVRNY